MASQTIGGILSGKQAFRFQLACAAATIICLAVIAELRGEVAALRSLPVDRRVILGGEYNNIAVALRTGKGFANPFGGSTGPTAWMPPVIPVILCFLYWVTNDSVHVVQKVIWFLHLVAVFHTGFVCFSLTKSIGRPMTVLVFYMAFLLVGFQELFLSTADAWLQLISLNLLLTTALKLSTPLTFSMAVIWGFVGGFVTLVNPVFGSAWGMLTLYSGFKKMPSCKACWRSLGLFSVSIGVACVLVVPWILWTKQVVGLWTAVKSNASYEFWQANCLDQDGIIQSSVFAHHPLSGDNANFELYARVGEAEFIRRFGQLSMEYLRQNPIQFVQKVTARFAAACLSYFEISKNDRSWLCVEVLRWLLFPMPFLGALIALLRPSINREELGVIILLYGCVLFPYVLISYYPRYGVPLLAIKIILVVNGYTWARSLLASCRCNKNLTSSAARM